MAIIMGYLRRTLSVATIKAQCSSLHGRLKGLGPGAAAAVNRSWIGRHVWNNEPTHCQ